MTKRTPPPELQRAGIRRATSNIPEGYEVRVPQRAISTHLRALLRDALIQEPNDATGNTGR